MKAAQLVRAPKCEASHQGPNPCVRNFWNYKNPLTGSLKYSGDDADLGAQYPSHGLVWAVLPGGSCSSHRHG
jgi:hypothetical protein